MHAYLKRHARRVQKTSDAENKESSLSMRLIGVVHSMYITTITVTT